MNHKNQAFTLVELAIVIVIIGLLVGGVLVGQELVKQAEIRSYIKRIQEVKSATATFYAKYNCLPGDCINGISLGLLVDGDGDQMITYTTNGGMTNFWLHLVKAKILNVVKADGTSFTTGGVQARFLDDQGATSGMMYGSYGDIYAGQTPGWPFTEAARINNLSFNVITVATQIGTVQAYAAFSPDDLRIIDEKTDDGNALTGKFFGANARLTTSGTVTICNTNGIYAFDSTSQCRALFQIGI